MLETTKPSALLIEDEQQIRRFVRLALESENWAVHEAASARDGLAQAATRKPDLVVLDLGLPDDDGLAVLRDIRTWSTAPVIVLSARADEQDKIAALDAGADDYLTKPFGLGELLARVRAAQRRSLLQRSAEPIIKIGAIEVDLARRSVTRGGAPVKLTPIEYRLLSTLCSQIGKVLTHRQILKEVWGPAYQEHGHYVRVHMGHLRQKLEADPAQPQHFLTESGVGYRLVS